MSTTAAHRRGKPLRDETGATVLIENGAAAPPPDQLHVIVPKATVRRHYCGTGPFDQHWLNIDCCGLFCAFFTYFLHIYAVYVVCFILLPPWMSVKEEDGTTRRLSISGIANATVFVALAVTAIISHFMAMTTDPGAVPPDAKPLLDPDELESSNNSNGEAEDAVLNLISNPKAAKVRRLCRRCHSFKPQRAHHCSICRRCIIKMDHHCPWVNNCVGIGNHKFFLLFIFYTFLSCLHSMILIIARFTSCSGDYHNRYRARHTTCLDKPSHLINILGLLVEALLFGLFTSCMMFDQSEVVFSKMTHIDRLKGADVAGSLAGVAEVFGVGGRGISSRFRLDWLSPLAKVCYPSSVRDEVMGFCRPCTANHVAPATAELAPPRQDTIV